MSLSISGHLNAKAKEEDTGADKVNESKPRTEFNFDPEKAITNHRLSVKSVNPDIISDIDSINEMVVDLDSSHQKRLLAKMEQNRKDTLEKTSDDVSYYENSDIYSDISRHQPTTATDRFDTSRKDSDLSSELSSLIELSPAHSEEDLNRASAIKLVPTAAKRVSVSSPAPLLSETSFDQSVKATQNPPVLLNTKHIVSEHVDVDEIPEVFANEEPTTQLKSEQQSEQPKNTVYGTNIGVGPTLNHARVKSYDEDSLDDFSEVSLPGLDDAKTPAPLPSLSAPSDQKSLPVTQIKVVSSSNVPVTESDDFSRPVDIDDDRSRASSNTSQKIVSEEEKLRYEKEIGDLKLRIHRVEKENNDMALHAAEKLKQYEYLENLAKSEMLNYPNKLSSIVQQPSTSTIARSPSGGVSSTNNLSIYKQFDDLKKSSDAKIESLNVQLKEEVSKTARFTVLKIQNEDQEKEIASLKEQLQDLKAQNLLITNQLSVAKPDIAIKDKQKENTGSTRDLGQLGYVHDQKKKWQEHAGSSLDLLNQGMKKSSSGLFNPKLKDSHSQIPSQQDQETINNLKREVENSKKLQDKAEKEKAQAVSNLAHFQSSIQNVVVHLAIPNLSFEQKDAIMIELNAMDLADMAPIKEKLQLILENIHQSSLQDNSKQQKHSSELESLNARISEVETESLKQWNEFMQEKSSLVAQVDSLQSGLKDSQTKVAEITLDLSSKNSRIEALQGALDDTKNELQNTKLQLKTSQYNQESLPKLEAQLSEMQKEYERRISGLQDQLSNAERQSAQWKNELEGQIESTKALQSTLEDSTITIRELSRKASENVDLHKLNIDLQTEIESLNSRIIEMQLGDSTHTEELEKYQSENDKLQEQLQQALAEQKELNNFIEHENEVNAELSARLAESLHEISRKDETISQATNEYRETAKMLDISNNDVNTLTINLKSLQDTFNTQNALHLAFKTTKEKELTAVYAEREGLLRNIEEITLKLQQSEIQRQELSKTIQKLQEIETRAISAESETLQQLSKKNSSLESLNKNLNVNLAKERGDAERVKAEYTAQLDAAQKELESLQTHKVSLHSDISEKKKRAEELDVLNRQLADDLKTEKAGSANRLREIEELKNRLFVKEEEILIARSEKAQKSKLPESEQNELQLLQSEKFKLECHLKMAERELFNERNRFQTTDLKWQETEHKCSAIERTNQLLEKELRSIRLKYEHILGEQTKMDLNTQETVFKLQSKIAEQRQIILDLQIVGQENKILQTQVEEAGEKIRNATAARPVASSHNSELITRITNLEAEFQKIQSIAPIKSSNLVPTPDQPQKKLVPPSAVEQTETSKSDLDALKQKMQKEFDDGIQSVNEALGNVFQTRRDVDREREINQDIIRKNYESRLEELSKQIRRRHY